MVPRVLNVFRRFVVNSRSLRFFSFLRRMVFTVRFPFAHFTNHDKGQVSRLPFAAEGGYLSRDPFTCSQESKWSGRRSFFYRLVPAVRLCCCDVMRPGTTFYLLFRDLARFRRNWGLCQDLPPAFC